MSRRLHETLHVETLEQLEAALHEGGGRAVAGIGPRRQAILRAALGQMLARIRPVRTAPVVEPTVDVLLDVDREYRSKADAGQLSTIAPRRFNPNGEAWLPVLHADRDGWHFTALFSNTARAHELGKVRDWVVLYFHSDSGGERNAPCYRDARCSRRASGGAGARARVPRRARAAPTRLGATAALIVAGATGATKWVRL